MTRFHSKVKRKSFTSAIYAFDKWEVDYGHVDAGVEHKIAFSRQVLKKEKPLSVSLSLWSQALKDWKLSVWELGR